MPTTINIHTIDARALTLRRHNRAWILRFNSFILVYQMVKNVQVYRTTVTSFAVALGAVLMAQIAVAAEGVDVSKACAVISAPDVQDGVETARSDLAATELQRAPQWSDLAGEIAAARLAVTNARARVIGIAAGVSTLAEMDDTADEMRRLQRQVDSGIARLSAIADEAASANKAASNDRACWRVRAIATPSVFITALLRDYDEAIKRSTNELSLIGKSLDQARTQALIVTTSLATITRSRAIAVEQVFVQNASPIWQANVTWPSMARWHEAAETQIEGLTAYVYAQRIRLVIDIALALIVGLTLRGYARFRGDRIALDLTTNVAAFDRPILAGFVITAAVTMGAYVAAPPYAWAGFLVVSLCAGAALLSRAHSRPKRLLVVGVIPLLLVDAALATLRGDAALVQWSLLVTAMIAMAVVTLTWAVLQRESAAHAGVYPAQRRLRAGAFASLVGVLLAVIIATATGYVTLALTIWQLLVETIVVGALVTLAWWLCGQIVQVILTHSSAQRLQIIRQHGPIVSARLLWLLKIAALFVWFQVVMDRLNMLGFIANETSALIHTDGRFGALRISISDVLIFFGAIVVAFWISRFIRFVLSEEVLPRTGAVPGLANAILTTLHYVILTGGFLVAMAALGVDMARFTILIGALTVGIGFGLQTIINNFVSGLILLFERPIQVGDTIQVDDAIGIVQRIGVRATTVRSSIGAEVIIPNGALVSGRVVNWTRSGRARLVEVSINLAAANPDPVTIDLLEAALTQLPGVLLRPAPEALVGRMAGDLVQLDLRVWTDQIETWQRVRSDVLIAASETLQRAGFKTL